LVECRRCDRCDAGDLSERVADAREARGRELPGTLASLFLLLASDRGLESRRLRANV
jgi:hypothetical protein